MKKLAISILASITLYSCQKEPVMEQNFDIHSVPTKYELTLESTLMMEEHIAGITHDGKNLWIMYHEEISGYYDDDNIRVVNYDLENNNEIKSFDYRNFIEPNGLAFDGNDLWVNYSSTGGETDLQRISIYDGSLLEQKGGSYNTRDIDFLDGNLYMFGYNDSWNIGKLDISSSAIQVLETDYIGALSNRGISARENELWTIDWASKHIAVNDMQGKMIGKVKTNFLDNCDHCYSAGHHSTFFKDKLIISHGTELNIFTIQ